MPGFQPGFLEMGSSSESDESSSHVDRTPQLKKGAIQRVLLLGAGCALVTVLLRFSVSQQRASVQERVAESQNLGAKGPCGMLWPMSVAMAVEKGWGFDLLSVGFAAGMLGDQGTGCEVLSSESTAVQWDRWQLALPGRRLRDPAWDRMWAAAPYAAGKFQFKAQGLPSTLSLGPDALAQKWWDELACGPVFGETMSGIFEQQLADYARPFGEKPYLAMHVRHGDKVVDGEMFCLTTFMETGAAKFNQSRIFLATDDANVLNRSSLDPFRSIGYQFRWTDGDRWPGGEPMPAYKEDYHHNSTTRAISAVIGDSLGLAKADFIVGSFDSNFFRLGWLLNLLGRTPEEREKPWCFDVVTAKPCDHRREYINEYCTQASQRWGKAICDPAALKKKCPAEYA